MLSGLLEGFVPVLSGLCFLSLCLCFSFPLALSLSSKLSAVSKPKISPTYQTRQEPKTLAYKLQQLENQHIPQSTRKHRGLELEDLDSSVATNKLSDVGKGENWSLWNCYFIWFTLDGWCLYHFHLTIRETRLWESNLFKIRWLANNRPRIDSLSPESTYSALFSILR